MGKLDNGMIDDDLEQNLNDMWAKMISSAAKIEVMTEKGEKDHLVANAHAILFIAFVSQPTIQLTVDAKNQQLIEQLYG